MTPSEILQTTGASTLLLGLLAYLMRNLIVTRLRASVEHEFNVRLESVRQHATLSLEESKAHLQGEIEHLRAEHSMQTSLVVAMAARQSEVERRRIQEVDSIWNSVNVLRPLIVAVKFAMIINFDNAKQFKSNANFMAFFENYIDRIPTIATQDLTAADGARPYLSEKLWCQWLAYRDVHLFSQAKLLLLKTPDFLDALDDSIVIESLKTACPTRSEYIDKHGIACAYYLLPEIELKILREIRGVLTGTGGDIESVARATGIARFGRDFRVASDPAFGERRLVEIAGKDAIHEIPRPPAQ